MNFTSYEDVDTFASMSNVGVTGVGVAVELNYSMLELSRISG